MGDLLKAVSGGFARFVFAWLMPSLISLGLFALWVLPEIGKTWSLRELTKPGGVSGITVALIFSFFVFAFSVVFAYASLPIYRVLEGYSLPRFLRAPLTRRHRRRFVRLKALEVRFKMTGVLPPGLDLDRLRAYPQEIDSVRATSLGNALTALETWSRNRYHLDSQSMWFELLGVSSDTVRQNTEEARAPVDFFVSAIAHASLLAVSCCAVAIKHPSLRVVLLGAGAAASVPLSYRLAVKNMLDWTQSVKAMVNLGRRDLADKLGLRMAQQLKEEQAMWSSHYYAIEWNHDQHVPSYDYYRIPPVPPPPPSGG